jgi:hypothetical protein
MSALKKLQIICDKLKNKNCLRFSKTTDLGKAELENARKRLARIKISRES